MTITSTAFRHNEHIPARYTCDGDNVNPPLTFSQIPDGAESLVLIVDDPDAPGGVFTHWLLYDMSPATLQILEHNTPATGEQGMNDFPAVGYGGPCPPDGTHHYRFQLYALNAMLNLPPGAERHDIDIAIEDKIVEKALLVGLYERQK